jgi:ketosteroid isomerase-like protein
MKEALLRTMLFALITAAGTSTVFTETSHPPTSKVSPAETEVRRANSEEVDAFLRNDPKAMERLWSEDFVVTNPLNKFVTKQQVLGTVHAGVLVITSLDRQIEYLRVYGDTVIVAGNETVVWGGKMPNAGKTEHLRFTGIWMKRRGHWQEVARHANIVPQ